MKESNAIFAFSYFDVATGIISDLDPRLGHFKVTYGQYNPLTGQFEDSVEVEIERVSIKNSPWLFAPDSPFKGLADQMHNIYTIADFSQINLKDTMQRVGTNKLLELSILRCD